MPDAPASPPPRRDRSIRARRKTRDAKAKRERQIIDLLNRGVSVAEIASLQRVSIMHMRKLVRKILSERAPEPPAEYLALQVSRLNEALLVSYSAMYNPVTGTNFEAVDRVVRIVREMDRYHGFAPVPRPREASETRLLPPPAESPIAIGRGETPVLPDGLSAPQAMTGDGETIQIGAATD